VDAARHPAPAPHDQRTRSAYIFGAICPTRCRTKSLELTPVENIWQYMRVN